MRIISGKLGGLRINPPVKMPFTRPTTDIAKEGLFNILQNKGVIENSNTLDLFGGTGCISYELFSRGASNCTIVEKDIQMFEFIKSTIIKLKIENNIQVFKQDIFKFIQQINKKFDIIFAGPPYSLQEIENLPILIFKHNLLEDNGIFILEHTPKNHFTDNENFSFQRNYGTTIFSFFIK